MPDINVTRLIQDANPFDFSASRAERGANAGPETWANATAEAAARPLDTDDREGIRDFFREFGAWDDEEIDAWSDEEVDALVLQYASGDLREAQSLCAGDGFGGIDWTEYEALAQEGVIGGNLYVHADALFVSLN